MIAGQLPQRTNGVAPVWPTNSPRNAPRVKGGKTLRISPRVSTMAVIPVLVARNIIRPVCERADANVCRCCAGAQRIAEPGDVRDIHQQRCVGQAARMISSPKASS